MKRGDVHGSGHLIPISPSAPFEKSCYTTSAARRSSGSRRARKPPTGPGSPAIGSGPTRCGYSSGSSYNLGNLLRRLVLPLAILSWSLTSLQQRLFKSGGRLIRHARYFVQLAESYLTSHLFCQIVGRIERFTWIRPELGLSHPADGDERRGAPWQRCL